VAKREAMSISRRFSKWWNINKAALADLSAEFLMGATNISGVVGNGRLSAGISRWGELTVLRWPTPSHFDQVNYVTRPFLRGSHPRVRMGRNAPCPDFRRWGRPFALENGMGSFGGISLPPPKSMETIWFHNPLWEFRQRYASEDSVVLETRILSPGLNLGVTIKDLVLPGKDLLVRRFEIGLVNPGPQIKLRFIYYENFSPTSRRSSLFPLDRFLGFPKDDFACTYIPREGCFLHFNPERDYRGSPMRWLRKPDEVQTDSPGLQEHGEGDGTYIAWGSDEAPTDFTIGPSRISLFSRLSRGGGGTGRDPVFKEVSRGELVDHGPNQGPSAAAAVWDVTISPGEPARIPIFIAIDRTRSGALGEIAGIRTKGFSEILEATEKPWRSWISKAYIPKQEKPEIHNTARRALLTTGVCRDSNTGAILASLSGQPRYCFDWPRDGAFLDLALDLAGYHQWVTRHLLLYKSLQFEPLRLGPFTIPRPGRPPGHFPTNFFSDGKWGNIPYIEIDQTGLVLWNMWRHASMVEGEASFGFLDRVYPAIRNGANALAKLVNPKTGMQKLAHEGDNPFWTRTLYGAVSCYLGLMAASLSGTRLGRSAEEISVWESRARALKDSSLKLFDPQRGRFLKPGWQGATWAIWPSGILPLEDPRSHLLASNLLNDFMKLMHSKRGALTYQLEYLLTAALVFREDPERKEQIEHLLELICSEATTPGTRHFGEVTLRADFDGDGAPEFQNRTSIPHLWKGALVYLVAAALERPRAFDRCVPGF